MGFDIEKIIHEKLQGVIEKMISEAVSDIFSYGSDISKQIKNLLRDHVKLSTDNIELPVYNDMMMKLVAAKINDQLISVGIDSLNKRIDKMFEPTKADWKMSEIVDKCKGFWGGDAGDSCTVEIEKSSIGHWVYLDQYSGCSNYKCQIRFGISSKDGGIFGLTIDGVDYTKKPQFDSYGIEAFFIKLYAVDAHIEIDEYDPYFSDDNDD
jgi:hypothetical protein